LFQFRRTGRSPSCSCWGEKGSGSGYSDSSSGSCLNSLPVEHCKMPGAADSISPHTIGTINHCMELEPSRHISGARYSVSSVGNISELGSNLSSPLDRVRHFQYGERLNASPFPDSSTPIPAGLLGGSPLHKAGNFGPDPYLDNGQIGSSLYRPCHQLHQQYPSSPYLTVVKQQCVSCLQDGSEQIQDYHQLNQDPYLTRSVDSQRKCMRSEPGGSIIMGSDV